jgi:hypothetical protein
LRSAVATAQQVRRVLCLSAAYEDVTLNCRNDVESVLALATGRSHGGCSSTVLDTYSRVPTRIISGRGRRMLLGDKHESNAVKRRMTSAYYT